MKENPLAFDAWERLAEGYASAVEEKAHNAFYDRPAFVDRPYLCA